MGIVSACIVLYKNDRQVLRKAINSFLNAEANSQMYLVDNSLNDDLRDIVDNPRVVYLHNPSNPGFGAAHNIAIMKAINNGGKYHFIVNPDVYFTEDVVNSMVEYMRNNQTVGMMMPQVLNEDGTVQNLPKLLPSPLGILWRKIKKPTSFYKKFIDRYELRSVPADKIYNAPVLSGCFTLLNLDAIKEIGLYDDNFFMYFEDWDLSRRMHLRYQTVYYPKVSIYHKYESGANRNIKLFKIFISSAITYFNKWGWIIDRQRESINNKALEQFR